MTPPAPGTAASPGDTAQMTADLESLKSFEREVLAILERLNVEHLPTVDAIPTQLVPAAFGTGFAEADDTSRRVLAVVEEVRNFARMLHKQIEALALSIRMATDSTAATEEENKRKLLLLIKDVPGEQPSYNVPTPKTTPADSSKSGVPPQTSGAPAPDAGNG